MTDMFGKKSPVNIHKNVLTPIVSFFQTVTCRYKYCSDNFVHPYLIVVFAFARHLGTCSLSLMTPTLGTTGVNKSIKQPNCYTHTTTVLPPVKSGLHSFFWDKSHLRHPQNNLHLFTRAVMILYLICCTFLILVLKVRK